MTDHTPGPWRLETVKTSCGVCHKVGPFPWKQGRENHACIYDDYPHKTYTPELFANARLIAAAPDLLGALQVTRTALGNAIAGRPVRCCDEILSEAASAIKKAIGEAND